MIDKIKNLPRFISLGLMLAGFIAGHYHLYLGSFSFLVGAVLFFLNNSRKNMNPKKEQEYEKRTLTQLLFRSLTFFLGLLFFTGAQFGFFLVMLADIANEPKQVNFFLLGSGAAFILGLFVMMYPSFRTRKQV